MRKLILVALLFASAEASAQSVRIASDECARPADVDAFEGEEKRRNPDIGVEAEDLNPWARAMADELLLFDIPLENFDAEGALFLRLDVDPETGEALVGVPSADEDCAPR